MLCCVQDVAVVPPLLQDETAFVPDPSRDGNHISSASVCFGLSGFFRV